MTIAFTLMTAMPPTKGHQHLMQFMGEIGTGKRGRVIVCTQPGEPFASERFRAVKNASYESNGVDVFRLHETLPQDPETPGFWEMWRRIMREHGFQPGDIFVSSEPYGQKLADICGGVFIPYDPNRELLNVKATPIRDGRGVWERFDHIMPSFQHNLRSTVTVFGAESTGKTTLSKELAGLGNGHWLFEWARPYLETVGPEITTDSMTAIWKGQAAAQRHTKYWYDKPFVVQDTDLFSTVGYWEQPHWAKDLGEVPQGLVEDAVNLQSDLYLILKSDIDFEPDPLRYGGDRRESSDEYWIGVADKYGLNYHVIESGDWATRTGSGLWAMRGLVDEKQRLISYDRGGF